MRRYRRFSSDGTFEGTFAIDESNFRRLVRELQKIVGSRPQISYKVQLKNGITYETKDLSDIFDEENTGDKKIKRVNIELESGQYSSANYKEVSVDLGAWSSDKISFSISGPDRDWVLVAQSKIEERIYRIRQWYWPIHKISSGLGGVISFFLIYILLFLMLLKIKDQLILSKGVLELTAYSLFVPSFILSYSSSKIVDWLFPAFAFEVGEEIKRMDGVRKLRERLFWTIIVGLMVSLIASRLFK